MTRSEQGAVMVKRNLTAETEKGLNWKKDQTWFEISPTGNRRAFFVL